MFVYGSTELAHISKSISMSPHVFCVDTLCENSIFANEWRVKRVPSLSHQTPAAVYAHWQSAHKCKDASKLNGHLHIAIGHIQIPNKQPKTHSIHTHKKKHSCNDELICKCVSTKKIPYLCRYFANSYRGKGDSVADLTHKYSQTFVSNWTAECPKDTLQEGKGPSVWVLHEMVTPIYIVAIVKTPHDALYFIFCVRCLVCGGFLCVQEKWPWCCCADAMLSRALAGQYLFHPRDFEPRR